jgi:hypothetical protein
MTSIPVARGLILCDAVRADPATGKLTLESCFNQLVARSFPASNRAFRVVAFLSDGFGDLTMRIQISHLEGDRTIYRREHQLRFPDRVVEVRYTYQVVGCVFPDAGTYEVELFADDEPLSATVFRLKPAGGSDGGRE